MTRARLKPDYVTVHFEYSRNVGPHSIHGGVTLAFTPAPEYSFASIVVWPSRDNYESAIRRGIEEALVRRTGSLPPLRATLEEIAWHDVNSCEQGFEIAGRIATDAAWET